MHQCRIYVDVSKLADTDAFSGASSGRSLSARLPRSASSAAESASADFFAVHATEVRRGRYLYGKQNPGRLSRATKIRKEGEFQRRPGKQSEHTPEVDAEALDEPVVAAAARNEVSLYRGVQGSLSSHFGDARLRNAQFQEPAQPLGDPLHVVGFNPNSARDRDISSAFFSAATHHLVANPEKHCAATFWSPCWYSRRRQAILIEGGRKPSVWGNLLNVLKYVVYTNSMQLVLAATASEKHPVVQIWSDSVWASDVNGRSSVSGGLVYLYGALVSCLLRLPSWKTKRHRVRKSLREGDSTSVTPWRTECRALNALNGRATRSRAKRRAHENSDGLEADCKGPRKPAGHRNALERVVGDDQGGQWLRPNRQGKAW